MADILEQLQEHTVGVTTLTNLFRKAFEILKSEKREIRGIGCCINDALFVWTALRDAGYEGLLSQSVECKVPANEVYLSYGDGPEDYIFLHFIKVYAVLPEAEDVKGLN